MKITFFTTQTKSPATIFYLAGLKTFPNLEAYSTAWKEFDVALVMGFREDFEHIKEAKRVNPKLKIGMLDPRGRHIDAVAEFIDFFIVDSLEMIDFFAHYSKPIFQYYEYFPVATRTKNHVKKDQLVIGYHGNKVHLMSMWPSVSEALSQIGQEYQVTFKVIYNKEKLSEWTIGAPANIKIEHVQLREDTYEDELHSCDIGIVPAFCPVPDDVYRPSFIDRKIYLLDEDDYILRFKVPSNAGRIIVFALLGVPVVADMLPSSCQFIQHGQNGFLAYSAGGWYQALKQLIDSPGLRNDFSQKLQVHTIETVDYEKQNQDLKAFLDSFMKRASEKKTKGPSVEFQRRLLPGLNLKFIKKKIFEGRGAPL